MGDPFVALLMQATTKGLINLKNYDNSRRWWAGCKIGMQHARRMLESELIKERLRMTVTQCASSGSSDSGLVLDNAYHAFEESLIPTNNRFGTDIDLVARFYLATAPHLIPK